jgi:hypothetical protein
MDREAVDLDDQLLLGPVRVDQVALDADVGAWSW